MAWGGCLGGHHTHDTVLRFCEHITVTFSLLLFYINFGNSSCELHFSCVLDEAQLGFLWCHCKLKDCPLWTIFLEEGLLSENLPWSSNTCTGPKVGPKRPTHFLHHSIVKLSKIYSYGTFLHQTSQSVLQWKTEERHEIATQYISNIK